MRYLNSVAGICLFGLAFTALANSEVLQCYQCSNVEVVSDSSGLFTALVGKSNPSCGTSPSSSNSVSCSTPDVCGSVSAKIRVDSVFGSAVVKTQIRGCMTSYDNSAIGGCTSTTDGSNPLIKGLFKGLATMSNVKVDGEICTCKFDYCTLCSGGIDAAGYCVKYWVIGLTAGGLVLVLILLVTCCCCCCGCCCCSKKSRGTVLSNGVPYHTMTVIPTAGNPNLSIQSGDIAHPGQTSAYMGVGATAAAYEYNEAAPGMYGAPPAGNYNKSYNYMQGDAA